MAPLLRLGCRWTWRHSSRLVLASVLILQAGCSAGGLFFLPQSKWVQNPANQGLAYEDVVLIHAHGERVHGWWLPAAGEEALGTVYFLHGNAENISTHLMNVRWLPARGFNVLLLDYRGYGLSDGQPSVPRALEDVQLGLDWLHGAGRLRGGPLIVLGQSLGASLTIAVLADQQNQGAYACLIAEAPFAGYRRIVDDVLRRHWLSWPLRPLVVPLQPQGPDPLDHIGKMSAPLLLLHSEADQVVPFSHAQLLYGAAPAGSRLEVVEGAHIAALNSAAVRDLVIEFIATACTANGGTPSGA